MVGGGGRGRQISERFAKRRCRPHSVDGDYTSGRTVLVAKISHKIHASTIEPTDGETRVSRACGGGGSKTETLKRQRRRCDNNIITVCECRGGGDGGGKRVRRKRRRCTVVCAPLSREPPRAFACVVAYWGHDVSSADGRRAAAADRTAGRAHDRCKGARRAAPWALGGGTCRRSLCACAPRRSNTAIIPWKHPVPQFARRYYIYNIYRRPSARQQLFISKNAYFLRAKNLTYNNTLRAVSHYYYYYYYTLFRYRSTVHT